MSEESTSSSPPDLQLTQAIRLVTDLIQALVDHADAARVDVVGGAQAVVFEVSVDPEDVRRVIGRKGRTADALRELLTNLGAKVGRRYLLEIVEPHNRPGGPLRPRRG